MSRETDVWVDNPESLAQRFFNMNDADKLVTLMALLINVMIWQIYNNILLTLPAVLVPVILLWKFTSRGRLYYTAWLVSQDWKIRWIDKGDLWVAGGKKSLNKVLPVEIFRLGDLGLIHNKRSKTVSCVVVGSGSDIASLPLLEQRIRIARLGEVTKRVSSLPDYSVGVNYLYREDPYNPWKFRDDIGTAGFPDILVPKYLDPRVSEEELTRDDQRRRNLHLNLGQVDNILSTGVDIVQTVATEEGTRSEKVHIRGARDTVMAAVITIKSYGLLDSLIKDAAVKVIDPNEASPNRKTGRKVKKPKVATATQAFELPIMEVARTCVTGLLSNKVEAVHVLSAAEVETFCRGVWDIADKQSYYKKLYEGTLGLLDHWPKIRICATKKASIVDNSTFGVVRVKRVPSPVLPNFLRTLHAMPLEYKSVTLVGETVRSSADYWALGRMKSFVTSLMEVFGVEPGIKAGSILDGIRTQQEKAANTTYKHLYNIVVSAGGMDSAALERQLYAATRAVEGLDDIQFGRAKGERDQDRALWSARAGVNML